MLLLCRVVEANHTQAIVKQLRRRKKRKADEALGTCSAGAVDVSSCGRIVVAGGGIGGAAMAVALQSKGFDVVVLEADDSFDSRKQGCAPIQPINS